MRTLDFRYMAVAALLGLGSATRAANPLLHNPIAVISALPTSGPPPLLVSVDGSASLPAHSPIATYDWDWGDGTPPGTGATASHTYTATGLYTLRLTITETGGLSSSTTLEVLCITTGNAPPTAVIDGASPQRGSPPLDVTFTGHGDDPAPAGDLHEHRWDFDDGSPVQVFPGVAAGASTTPLHTYTSPGTYFATLTVTDLENIYSVATFIVSVEIGGAPTAAFTVTPLLSTVPLTVQVDASASFDTGGPLTDYHWDWGDGTLDQGPAAVSLAHTYWTVGTFAIVLTVTDNAGAQASLTRLVHVVSPGQEPPDSQIQEAIPQAGPAPLGVIFVGYGNSTSSLLEHRWDFGDGSPPVVFRGVPGVLRTLPAHTYALPGKYVCTLQVTDQWDVYTISSIEVTATGPGDFRTESRSCALLGAEVVLLWGLAAWIRRRRRFAIIGKEHRA